MSAACFMVIVHLALKYGSSKQGTSERTSGPASISVDKIHLKMLHSDTYMITGYIERAIFGLSTCSVFRRHKEVVKH